MKAFSFFRRECEACGRKTWRGVLRFGLWFCSAAHVPTDWHPYIERMLRRAGL